MLQSLYGTEITEEHCIGYCRYHRCYMTCKQLKRKECLRKQCGALEKHDHHEFWKQREIIKMKKKSKGAN